MTPVTGLGSEFTSPSISSCFKCQKVISLCDQLTKNMHEFEIVTMEMQFEFDLKSAKSKSIKVLSNFWQLISMIKTITITGEKEETGKDSCKSPNESKLIVNVEKREVEKENESAKSTSKIVAKMRRRPNVKPNPNPNVTEKRRIEIQRANRLFRTIKCETLQGFYNLFECTKCQRQFNTSTSARRHVQVKHLCLGTKCPTCPHKFFDKTSLELHIPKCSRSKQNQFGQIKVWLHNDMKNPVKVQLQPHQKQRQVRKQKEASSTWNQTFSRKIINQDAEKKRRNRVFDPLRIKVRNPFENFSLEKTLNVKVVIQRLEVDKNGENSSKTPTQIQTMEKIEMETGKETNSSQEAENQSCVAVWSCDEI